MPTYQYRCTDCGESFERYQSFSDDPITVCPLPPASVPGNGEAVNGADANCGGEVRKIFSNVGISFKGSGFYRNDSRTASRSSSSSDSASSSSSSSSESASKTSASSDSSSSSDTSSSTVGAASASG